MSYDEEGNWENHQKHGLSKAEIRKSNKPIMEKRRRARINSCLDELKSLILQAMKKDPSRHTKLEKADILELTVRHLQDVQQKPSILTKFSSGFSDCADEVLRFVGDMEEIDEGIKQRLTRHLGGCISNMAPGGAFGGLEAIYSKLFENLAETTDSLRPRLSTPLHDPNNNHLQAVRLSSGEFALVLPNHQLPTVFDLSMPRVSAFNVVQGGPVSPPASPNYLSNFSESTPKLLPRKWEDLEKFPTPPDEKNMGTFKSSKFMLSSCFGTPKNSLEHQSSDISSSTSNILSNPNNYNIKEEPSHKRARDDGDDFLVTKRAKVERPVTPPRENVWRPW